MGKQRTNLQNNALHLMFEQLADELNDRGIERKVVMEQLDKYGNVPWTKESIKEIWRALQMALLLKKSTTELTTKEIDEVFEVLSREVLTPLGIELNFPSIEELMWEDRLNEKK